MNSPTENRRPRKPRRAEPLQPDLPGSGTDKQDAPGEDKRPSDAERQAEQSCDALDNVRQGYG